MGDAYEFQLSIEVKRADRTNPIADYDSLSGILKKDANVRVLNSSAAASSSHFIGAKEERGFALIGLLLGIVSSGAAATLLHGIAVCFRGPRVSSVKVVLRNANRDKSVELSMDSMDKQQMDSAIAVLTKFLEESNVAKS
ncbi:MAG TPA: hypothetical protein VGN12_19055 [Pirellulales bacterium]|jgi:hypothetical protein